MVDIISRAPTCPLLIAGIILLSGSAFATGPEVVESPVPVEAIDGSISGYDWASREEHAHILLRGDQAVHLFDLDTIATPFLDIEVTGLSPGRLHALKSPEMREGYRYYANGGGMAVFWSIPADAGVWTLVDNATGDVILTLTMFEATGVTAPERMYMYHCYCYMARMDPRSATHRDVARTIEQAAFSWSTLVSVGTTNCFEHSIKVHAKASGGQAVSSSIGGDFTYTHAACDTIVSGEDQ